LYYPNKFTTFAIAMKRFGLIILCCTLYIANYAEVTPSTDLQVYYQKANGKKSNYIRKSLRKILGNHTVVSYNNLRYLEVWSDTENADGKTLIDIYTSCPFFIENQRITYSNGYLGAGLNREHTVPKSWFASADSMYSDAFHIYPTDAYANNHRRDNYYGECEDGYSYSNDSCIETGRLGWSTWDGNYNYEDDQVYEPADEYKGDLARGYFYMATRYADSCANWGHMFGNENNGLTNYAAEILLKWHREDPVSEKELIRNEVIYGDTTYNKCPYSQGNRNPFIDYPCLAEYIWGNKKNETLEFDKLTSAYDEVFVNNPSGCYCDTIKQTVPTILFALANDSIEWGNHYTNTLTTNSTGRQKYSTSDDSIASVNSKTGLVTAHCPGLVRITVSIAATQYHYAASQYYTLRITKKHPHKGDYEKVTKALTDYTGQYLVVYEQDDTTAYVFNGGTSTMNGTSTQNNLWYIPSHDHFIRATPQIDSASFTFSQADSGRYAILSFSGYYIGHYNGNAGVRMADTYSWYYADSIYWLSTNRPAIRGLSGNELRYNAAGYFRFYPGSQRNTTIYKKNTAPISYAVRFFDSDGQLLKTDSVVRGSSAQPPLPPEKTGLAFLKWDTLFTSVKTDINVQAVYRETAKKGDYMLLRTPPESWNGHYLIAHQNSDTSLSVFKGNQANWSISSTGQETLFSLPLNTDYVTSTPQTDSAAFLILEKDSGVIIRTSRGNYVGWEWWSAGISAGFPFSNYWINQISISQTEASILSKEGMTLRYNYNGYFRFYNDTQLPIILLKKIENEPTLSEFHTTLCQGDSLLIGTDTIISATQGDDLLTSHSGADSLVLYTIEMAETNSLDSNLIVCDNEVPINWNGQWLEQSGNYIDTLVNRSGCDSIDRLSLNILASSAHLQMDSISEDSLPYKWRELFITQTGYYSDTLINHNGCDSIVSLSLVVIESAEQPTAIQPLLEDGIIIRNRCVENNQSVFIQLFSISGKCILKTRKNIDLTTIPLGGYILLTPNKRYKLQIK